MVAQQHGLPEGRPGTCRLAVAQRGQVIPATLDVQLADLDVALPAMLALDPDRSTVGARAGQIVDESDGALVFTQYRAMGELLSGHLSAAPGTGLIPFLHGGFSAVQRDRMVHALQDDDDAPPILLLSLRAAGFGLNLTRAAHVMHYDRWWNPAVEKQATDRAHRIGQHRTLNVYTLVTGGTIEDHIARLNADSQTSFPATPKPALANLSDEELHTVLDLDLGAFT